MKNLKLFEAYVESPEYRIRHIFEELEKNINQWFQNGQLAKQKANLINVKRSTTNFLDKTLILNFNDAENTYQIIFVISLQDVTDKDKIENAYVKIKMYDDDDNLLRTYVQDIKLNDIKEDKIIELLAKIQQESDSLNDESENSLEDDETNLEDTSMF